LHVSGNQIANGDGTPVQLDGVNRSGTEYACIQGWGFFDGPSDQTSIAAIAAWHVHVVRVPLNEDCWLGINLPNPAYGGSAYRKAVASYVHLLEQNGMDVILDLHWSAPGTEPANEQQMMPDLDHSPAFWRSVARKFGQDRAVLFDLYNEPHDVRWGCWLKGCILPAGWRAAGMQRLVTTVRNAGAQNILMIGGLGWSGDLTKWQSHIPSDPLGQLVASWHVYDFGSCTDQSCWAANVAGVGSAAPVLLGEFGETDCGHSFVDGLMSWADGQGIGYVAWTWDTWDCDSGPALITDYGGTPTGFGQGVRDHYVIRFPGP
jgi:endoglucanase